MFLGYSTEVPTLLYDCGGNNYLITCRICKFDHLQRQTLLCWFNFSGERQSINQSTNNTEKKPCIA